MIDGEAEFVYTGFIWKNHLDNLKFDFYVNGENTFTERKLFYNNVIREIAGKHNLQDSFIAGDFFIKYHRSNFDSEKNYNEFCSNQPIDVYIYSSKIKHESTFDDLLETINQKYHHKLERDINVYYKYVFATFNLDKITMEDEVELKNIRIHVCYKKFKILVKDFQFKPFKIGYIYNNNHLITGNWFMKGGELGDDRKKCMKFNSYNCQKETSVSFSIYF